MKYDGIKMPKFFIGKCMFTLNNLIEEFQSSFRVHHKTESALLNVTILMATDNWACVYTSPVIPQYCI